MYIYNAAAFDPTIGSGGTPLTFDGPFFSNRSSVGTFYLDAFALSVVPNKANNVNGQVQIC